MNKEPIERLALEVASAIGKYDDPLDPVEFATRFLVAYLAERGKESVGSFTVNQGKSINQVIYYETGLPDGDYQLFTTPQPCPDCLKWATDMSQVTKTLRYLIGIAERGTATTLPDGVTVESFVLDYVKGLEANVAELTKERDEEQIVGDKLFAKLTRAEVVIGKCNLALELNVPLLTTRLAAIFAISKYREGK